MKKNKRKDLIIRRLVCMVLIFFCDVMCYINSYISLQNQKMTSYLQHPAATKFYYISFVFYLILALYFTYMLAKYRGQIYDVWFRNKKYRKSKR
jgi:hypothetical protein